MRVAKATAPEDPLGPRPGPCAKDSSRVSNQPIPLDTIPMSSRILNDSRNARSLLEPSFLHCDGNRQRGSGSTAFPSTRQYKSHWHPEYQQSPKGDVTAWAQECARLLRGGALRRKHVVCDRFPLAHRNLGDALCVLTSRCGQCQYGSPHLN
jgi:hypothetical protein